MSLLWPHHVQIWQGTEDLMFNMLPRVSAYQAALNNTIDLERRAFTDIAGFLSDRKLVAFVGLSSAYWAPPHDDFDDIGFT
jgi:hypothetical protein